MIKVEQLNDQKEMNASRARAVSVVCKGAVSGLCREHGPETNKYNGARGL